MRIVLGLLLLQALPSLAAEPAYPVRPIRYVVGAPPGGATDIFARAIGLKLFERWGQQVVVDNRAGASGIVGADIVAKSVPDGHTLLMVYTSHVTNPSLFSKLPYDTVRDFASVTMVATVPNILALHPSVAASSVSDLVALARAKPGVLAFGSAGNGTATHLAGVLFGHMTGAKMIHVPYKGASPALTDLIGGQTSLMFGNMVSTLPHVRGGKLRGLAVTGLKRSSAAPEFPTLDESGLKGYDANAWFATFASSRTPPAVLRKLNAEIRSIVEGPEMREKMTAQGAEPWTSTPAELDAYVKSEIARWGKVIRESGARAD